MNRKVLREISVAILSFNRRDELRETLHQLYAYGDCWHETIVADNGSTDGTVDMLLERFPHVRLLRSSGNAGVRGINSAYRMATGRWILSLDDDSAPDLKSWSSLSEELEKDLPHGLISLSVRSPGNIEKGVGESKCGLPERDPYLQVLTPGREAHPVLTPTFGFSQAGCLLNRNAIASIGGYDEELFLWAVELHWAARALIDGWSLARCDSAQVVHRSVPANRKCKRHAFHYCRNTLLFICRFVPAASLSNHISSFLRDVLVFSVLHGTTVYIKAVIDAYRMLRIFDGADHRLNDGQLLSMCPDWRAAFSYLG